ncbi:hypothetical protein BJX63DRAFT_11401 [Aspergillus granulosus]|uniref:Uncharacterized protein n=1 Tax=Aspergillus granulosus TaxID=176169 RepID=A0ABR4HVE4_9EURO
MHLLHFLTSSKLFTTVRALSGPHFAVVRPVNLLVWQPSNSHTSNLIAIFNSYSSSHTVSPFQGDSLKTIKKGQFYPQGRFYSNLNIYKDLSFLCPPIESPLKCLRRCMGVDS